jgi:hypothetical protein
MRKSLFVFLLLAGTVTDLSAQYQNGYYYYQEPWSTTADATFDRPKPGKAKVNFHFLNAFKNGRITLELTFIKQMNYLPDLDSIIAIAKNAILPLADSLKQDGIVRRVDAFINAKASQIRIINHGNRPSTFVMKDGELSILKTDQDTLRIKFLVKNGRQIKMFGNDGKPTGSYTGETAPVFVTIITNNFDDLNTLPANIMQTCLALLKQDITPGYADKSNALATYSAYYNVPAGKRFSPKNPKWIKYGVYRKELVPNIYGSLQFARGSFVPSMAAGLRYSIPRSTLNTTRFYLMWEPYFFFSRDAQNKIVTDRNDFITFRYIEEKGEERKNGGFEFIGNCSLGYLAGRRGEWFEKNTFKLGLPGVRSGWLQLEPELYFNNFVRNFSPSLKLTLHYE